LGVTGNYLDITNLTGQIIEVEETFEGSPEKKIKIVWYGELLLGEVGSLVDFLVWEEADPIFNATTKFLGVFKNQTSYWRCDSTKCVVFYV
jgi:hypothetical protein